MAAGHSGAGSTFVEQDQTIGIKVKLSLEPSLALDHDIGALLLTGGRPLFYACSCGGQKSATRFRN